MENSLKIVGIGPGKREWRTVAAEEAIKSSDYIVGYKPYLDLICDLLPGKKIYQSGMGKETERVRMAAELAEKGSVALVSSGDANVYGMAGLGLEMSRNPGNVNIIPGITSFIAAAANAGLVFRECVASISLSDLLTSWHDIECRLNIASKLNIPLAIYNPRSKKRSHQLVRALEILGDKDVLIAKNIGRDSEEMLWTTSAKLLANSGLQDKVDMTTLLIACGRGVYQGRTGREAKVNIVGIGPGDAKNITLEAKKILENSNSIFGAEKYLAQIKNNFGGSIKGKMIFHPGTYQERISARFTDAFELFRKGQCTSILTGGDPGIFSAGWRILERADCSETRVPVHISPGISAFSIVAAKAGAPLVNDFVLLSQNTCRTEISNIAKAGFGIVIYSIKGHEIAALLQEIDPSRPVVLARDVSRIDEEMLILPAHELAETRTSGLWYTLMISPPSSEIQEGKVITKRGYESKYSY